MTEAAVAATAHSYSPYSGYKVGAAILCVSGDIYAAPNIEAATYSGTSHAETNAIANAVSGGEAQGGRRFIKALVVSHANDTAPCGECRQRIAEFCNNAVIINVDLEGNLLGVTSLRILLPYAFTPSDLGKK